MASNFRIDGPARVRLIAACLTLAAVLPASAQAPARPGALARALRSNVMIESGLEPDERRLASGVILQLRDGVATIATARHVVDRTFATTMRAERPALDALPRLSILTIDRQRAAATVEWLAPDGIDLAILSAPLPDTQAAAASWNGAAMPPAGAPVFTVGNPHGAGWTRASGTLAQIRERQHEDRAFRVLQTNLQIRPGNSGGGLYDAAGRLIGINSMGGSGGDPRFPGGLGLSTALSSLLDLAPQRFGLGASSSH